MKNGVLKTGTLIMAPIRGVTDGFFRKAFHETFGGFHGAVAPFFRVEREGITPRTLRDLSPVAKGGFPTIPQILTADPDTFVKAARLLRGLGYDELNWNLGCPHRQVTKKKMGAGLLETPDEIRRFLDIVCPVAPISVSIKTRLGLSDDRTLVSLLGGLSGYPIDKIIIHPRTAEDMYDGPIRLDAFERCLTATSHRVVFNGDICTVNDLEALQTRFPSVSDWMIGRGALASPFLPGTLRTGVVPTDDKQRVTLEKFHQRLFQHYRATLSGDAHLLAKMQSIWDYMAPALPEPGKFAKKIRRAKSLIAYEGYIEKFLQGSE